jgi:hypothetical protein
MSRDDVFWTADDNLDRICAIDRRTGECVGQTTQEEILLAFPEAGACEDGDGDPATDCSYTDELEAIAYDSEAAFLYVFNTVNDPGSPIPTDRPAVFRFRIAGCRACLTPDAWQPLPVEYSYRAAVVIDRMVYISNGQNLHAYDFDTNTVTEQPIEPQFPGVVNGLSYDAGTLFGVTQSRRLVEVDWAEGEVSSVYDLDLSGLSDPDGLAVARDSIYVLDGVSGSRILKLVISGDPQ